MGPNYNLTIDCGNTHVRLALWDVADRASWPVPVAVGCLDEPRAEAIADFAALKGVAASRAVWCSVRTDLPEAVRSALARAGCQVTVFDASTPVPLAVDYDRTRLGADRLAAAVGAWSLPGMAGHDLLIADLGTAATYDHVSADGHFVGGNIAPGITMRLRALHAGTSRLPAVLKGGKLPLWGTDTASAMRAGAVRGVAAEVAGWRSMLAAGAVTLLTGGDAGMVAPLLDFETVTVPDLVGIGLNSILLRNEDN